MLSSLKNGKLIRIKLNTTGTTVLPTPVGSASPANDTVGVFFSQNRFRDIAEDERPQFVRRFGGHHAAVPRGYLALGRLVSRQSQRKVFIPAAVIPLYRQNLGFQADLDKKSPHGWRALIAGG